MINFRKDYPKFEVIFDHLNLEKDITALEDSTKDPQFWSDQEKAQNIMKQLTEKKSLLSEKRNLIGKYDDLHAVIELYKESNDKSLEKDAETIFTEFREQLENMELKLLLNEKYDSSNAYFSIHPGAGGTESQDWAQMLYRMYTRWFEIKKYQFETIDFQPGEIAGIKSVTVMVKGPFAYGYLKGEKGVHRLVRISPFDANARRHTSFASVDVFPEINEEVSFEIKPEDLRVDTYRSSGAGGQHVNKTESAIRITHIPTNIVVSCQQERSQLSNRNTAMKMLHAKLYEHYQALMEENLSSLKGEKKEISWGSQIRSYVFQPYTLVKDHRTNHEIGNIQKVMDGYIDEFIKEYLLVSKGGKKKIHGKKVEEE